jgi:hypothetical protein
MHRILVTVTEAAKIVISYSLIRVTINKTSSLLITSNDPKLAVTNE